MDTGCLIIKKKVPFFIGHSLISTSSSWACLYVNLGERASLQKTCNLFHSIPKQRRQSFFRYILFLFIYFILFLNFTILYWFCQISKWICHRYTCVPHPEPSSLLPTHTLPLGRPSAPASSIVHQTWTGNSFHTWYFTCFNAILPNLPTLSLSHRVHKTDLYISVSFAVLYTGLLLPSF